MTTILFLCVANSARSQMAEGLARQMLGPDAMRERFRTARDQIKARLRSLDVPSGNEQDDKPADRILRS